MYIVIYLRVVSVASNAFRVSYLLYDASLELCRVSSVFQRAGVVVAGCFTARLQ